MAATPRPSRDPTFSNLSSSAITEVVTVPVTLALRKPVPTYRTGRPMISLCKFIKGLHFLAKSSSQLPQVRALQTPSALRPAPFILWTLLDSSQPRRRSPARADILRADRRWLCSTVFSRLNYRTCPTITHRARLLFPERWISSGCAWYIAFDRTKGYPRTA